MQERRSTVRVNRFCRAQYCPADDLLPRDGRLTTVSERGAGLLVREPRHHGEQVTVGFSLPGDPEPLTATGVVQWAAAMPLKGHWYPLGLEWLPLEEATRHRLHQFLYDDTRSRRRPAAAAPPTAPRWLDTPAGRPLATAWDSLRSRVALAGVGLAGAILLVTAGAWVSALRRQNAELRTVVDRRNAVLLHLKQQGARIQQELGETRQHLVVTSAEVARMDELAHRLGGAAQRLGREVEWFQDSYVRTREEREELWQRVQDFSQERTLRTQQSVSIPDLHRAIREAIQARQTASRPLIPLLPGGAAALFLSRPRTDLSLDGNRGYMVWEGRPTGEESSLSIRVHDPEPLR